MARTVKDAVLMLEAMMGKDARDSASLSPIELSQHLLKEGLKGKRIGVVKNLAGYNEAVDRIFAHNIEQMRAAGATIVEDLTLRRNWGGDEYQVLKTEFKADLNTYLKKSKAPVESLSQIIELNKKHSTITMPHFGQDILIESENDPDIDSEEYKSALANAKRKAGEEGIDALLQEHNLDLLVAPTTSPAWKIDLILGDHFLGSASSAAAVAGYPHITVPMGFIEHLPINMSFFAGKLDEPTLIEAAYGFEQLTQARKPPVLKP
jgi:amidase/aspartyl-tRNA(Asn)/glutamyl-tRNA(Gln) amidotransferase subunit A